MYKTDNIILGFQNIDSVVFAEQESDTLSVQRVESVDEEYLAEIEALIAQSEMETAIKTYMSLDKHDKIGIVDILQSYCTLHKM